ncbi:hypothetical protein BrE312_0949 [Brenneria sp. EniD312]|nr:hypothetical protein BrE312_0949 [Brenneria sp. EniD312]
MGASLGACRYLKQNINQYYQYHMSQVLFLLSHHKINELQIISLLKSSFFALGYTLGYTVSMT